ncbi:hypothetical protein [Pyrobaculum aerophilum]|uniref:Uncharacterized protein n=1 Tax=Pyrobaculum aerophilum TaxID=13773 RepID=A0A371QWK2_9CREN|nr:hypothetical protein [Pyrobaculum aerophilum]MCX8135976.1 hypothetical protein [Pyrobaculum aerophilum]RFA94615.1 hypothetical protein CGL51_09475 [Pyrobaculum aerophilum]RFB00278.1 hypothetical protein CGL52_01515 [Pyrobaculum aerophilum]
MKTLRESSLKLLKNRKKRLFKTGGYHYSQITETELKLFLSAFETRCDLCGRRLDSNNIGYLRVGAAVELALCEQCLGDYAELIAAEFLKQPPYGPE